MTVALFLLSRLSPTTSAYLTSGEMLLLGMGLGMVMQVLVIAVQNAVDYRDLGVATSGATLFRLVGGSLGTAALGAIFAARLATNQAAGAAYAPAFTAAINSVFLTAAAICAAGFALTWLLPERPLRATVAATARDAGNETSEAFGLPADEESAQAQLYAALSSLSDRAVQRQHIERIVARAGETLSPLAAYLLTQLEREPERDPAEIGEAMAIIPERVRAALEELQERGLIADAARGTRAHSGAVLTAAGCDVLDRLVAARRVHLEELASEWDPDRHDVSAFLTQAVERVVPNARRGV
jgi:hypothetical protein